MQRSRVRVPQGCQPVSPPRRWQRLGGSSAEQNQLGFQHEGAGSGARSDLLGQKQLPEPPVRPRRGKESPKMSRGGCQPQVTALPGPPATLGWGRGVRGELLQTSVCKETEVLARMVASPRWELVVPNGSSLIPPPPIPPEFQGDPQLGVHPHDVGAMGVKILLLGRPPALPQPWPGHCCPPPATSHPAPMGAPSQAGGSPHLPQPSLPCCQKLLMPGWGDPFCPPSLENSHLSPQKPPAKPFRVPPEKVATCAVEDAAEPGKLVSFVIRVRAELAAQQRRPALPTAGLRSLGLFPPAGKASKGRRHPSASQIYSKCSNYRGLPPAAALADNQGSRCLPLPQSSVTQGTGSRVGTRGPGPGLSDQFVPLGRTGRGGAAQGRDAQPAARFGEEGCVHRTSRQPSAWNLRHGLTIPLPSQLLKNCFLFPKILGGRRGAGFPLVCPR